MSGVRSENKVTEKVTRRGCCRFTANMDAAKTLVIDLAGSP